MVDVIPLNAGVYAVSRVCRILGPTMTPRKVHYWLDTGLLSPPIRHGRPGLPTLLSFRQLLEIRTVQGLRDDFGFRYHGSAMSSRGSSTTSSGKIRRRCSSSSSAETFMLSPAMTAYLCPVARAYSIWIMPTSLSRRTSTHGSSEGSRSRRTSKPTRECRGGPRRSEARESRRPSYRLSRPTASTHARTWATFGECTRRSPLWPSVRRTRSRESGPLRGRAALPAGRDVR